MRDPIVFIPKFHQNPKFKSTEDMKDLFLDMQLFSFDCILKFSNYLRIHCETFCLHLSLKYSWELLTVKNGVYIRFLLVCSQFAQSLLSVSSKAWFTLGHLRRSGHVVDPKDNGLKL